MTTLAVLASDALVVLTSDSSARGEPPVWMRQKLFRLSTHLPITAALGGVAGAPSWGDDLALVSVLSRFRDSLDSTIDLATYSVAAVSCQLATHLHATYRERWTLGTMLGVAGVVAGFDPGSRHPVVVDIGVVAEGVLKCEVIMQGGAGGAIMYPAGPERVRRPRNREDAVTLAAELVERRIEEHARHPEAGRNAVGPVHALALEPAA